MNRPALPDAHTVRAAMDTVLADAAALGRRPTLTAVERHLGLAHATFYRHYSDLITGYFQPRIPRPAAATDDGRRRDGRSNGATAAAGEHRIAPHRGGLRGDDPAVGNRERCPAAALGRRPLPSSARRPLKSRPAASAPGLAPALPAGGPAPPPRCSDGLFTSTAGLVRYRAPGDRFPAHVDCFPRRDGRPRTRPRWCG